MCDIECAMSKRAKCDCDKDLQLWSVALGLVERCDELDV